MITRNLIILSLCFLFSASEYQMEDQVHILKDSNFNKFIKEHKYSLVDFHLPWCGWCKKVAPHIDRLAIELQSFTPSIAIGKLDCTKQEKIKTKFGIDKFPTIMLWNNGKNTTFEPTEVPTTEAILKWIATEISIERKSKSNASWIPSCVLNVQSCTFYISAGVIALLIALKTVRRLIQPTASERKNE